MIEIVKGETKLEKISLINTTKHVLIETLTGLTAELFQGLNTFASYVYPCAQFRLGAADNEVLLETTEEVSRYFLPGRIRCKLTMKQPSADFLANPDAVDVYIYDIYNTVIENTVSEVLVVEKEVETILQDYVLILASSSLLASSELLCSGGI